MCAGYGLGGGSSPLPLDLEPMSEPANEALLADWALQRDGAAKITGKNARNLNPLIHSFGGERELELAWWWIWLDGSGPVRFSAFNSRDDKLMRSWRRSFQHRAILPATWYVEKGRTFELPDGELFGLAAVTSTVTRDDTGEQLLTYSMVTRQAVGEAATVHDRMPLALPRELHDEWLDPERAGDAALVDEVRLASDEISRAMRIAEPDVKVVEESAEQTLF